jgi:hypothetical protein
MAARRTTTMMAEQSVTIPYTVLGAGGPAADQTIGKAVAMPSQEPIMAAQEASPSSGARWAPWGAIAVATVTAALSAIF